MFLSTHEEDYSVDVQSKHNSNNCDSNPVTNKFEESYKAYAQPDDIEKIHNHRVCSEVLAEYDTNDKVRTYFAATGSVAYKKSRVKHIIDESIYHLKVKIFGHERLRLSRFVQSKQTANQMKVAQSMKISSWCEQFDTFQTYLPMCLWLAGAKRGEWPTAYDEHRKREILEFALSAV